MKLSNRTIFEQLLDKWEPEIRTAFLKCIEEVTSNIVLRVVAERLREGDLQGAIGAMHLDVDAYARLERTILQAYNDGGQATVDDLPRLIDPQGSRIVFRWGVRNLGGEAELRQNSATMVQAITADQIEGVRFSLEAGLQQGRNPTETARDVIGRVNSVTGRREGGIIGLTAHQARAVETARQRLLSGDPDEVRKVLDLGRRDKRFDRSVAKAVKEGKPLPQEFVARWTGRYADSLLKLRGDMVARTETIRALGKARDDAIRQQIAEGKIDAQDVTKRWVATHDGRTRFTHRALDGKRAEMNGVFHSPSGAMLAYPGDPNAPASETVMCRCSLIYDIDRIAAFKRRNGF